MKYRDYSDESDFDFDADTESDAGESEVAWAQCDSCDKWRQHNMSDPNGKFQCEMVGNGVSCATPEDEDEDPSAGKDAGKDIIHDALVAGASTPLVATSAETNCSLPDSPMIQFADSPMIIVADSPALNPAPGKDESITESIRDSPAHDSFHSYFDISSEFMPTQHFERIDSKHPRQRNSQWRETDSALREMFGDHDFNEFQEAVQHQRQAVQQQRAVQAAAAGLQQRQQQRRERQLSESSG